MEHSNKNNNSQKSNISSNTKNCRICGRVFSHPRNTLCPECMIRDEEDFQKVREFLKEFPGSKIDKVEEYTQVSRRKILKYLKEQRIELAENSPDLLKCAKCGSPIRTGMYCADCYRKFTNEVKSIYSTNSLEKDNDSSVKMHIKHRRI